MKIGSEGSGARLCLCRPVGLRPTALRTNILVSAIRFVSIVADFNILAVSWAKNFSKGFLPSPLDLIGKRVLAFGRSTTLHFQCLLKRVLTATGKKTRVPPDFS